MMLSLKPFWNRQVLRGFILVSCLSACRPNEKGPEVPTPDLPDAAVGERDLNNPSDEDALPADGLYADLPSSFRSGISACETDKRYFDLTVAICTATPLASFTCTMEALLSPADSVLTEQLRTKLKDYVDANLVDFKLFACTESADTYELHFYKPEADNKVRSYNVKLVRPVPAAP